MADPSSAGQPRHVVAIVGGACSGAEAAAALADRGGIVVVVFEQNARPYGKIEDGLPRWHDKQRAQEYEKLREKLSRPAVHFVPLTRLGRDVQFDDLVHGWGFSAVLLAHGAWRDRPLGLAGADAYVGRGLIYQNPFIYWFNHCREKAYDGARYEVSDDAIVVGGGLASIDVVKVLQFETVGRALAARGIAADMLTLEKKGISTILKEHGLSMEALGLAGCTLYYRRRMIDMPVASYKDGATPEERRKTEETRTKLMHHAMGKYLFRFKEGHLPIAPLIENERLIGLRFIRTEIREGKVINLPGTEVDVRSPLTISSIGSIPETIGGIPMKGEFYRYANWDTGELEGFTGVYGLGNVVTGKGNIAVSRRHGKFVADHVAAAYLGLADGPLTAEEGIATDRQAATRDQVGKIAGDLQRRAPLPPETVDAILARVRERQRAVGFDGDYAAWIRRVTPPDLE
jgi:hypothetical protein